MRVRTKPFPRCGGPRRAIGRLPTTAFLMALLTAASSAPMPAFSAPGETGSPPEGEVVTLWVGPDRAPCTAVGPRECLQARRAEDGPYTLFYDAIEGFEYHPGQQYELKVEITPVAHPPADGSSLRYRLVEIVHRQADPLHLEDTSWQLRTLRRPDAGLAPLAEGERADARFQAGKVAGHGGCNRYFAGYQLDGAHLTISPGGGTLMACPGPAMALEQDFHAALGATAGFRIEAARLRLLDAEGEAVAEFEVDRPPALTDTDWRLLNYNTGSALLSSRTTEKMTARFGSDAKLTGFAGCNRFFGGYELTGDDLRIGPLAATRMACAEPEDAMRDEAGYLQALQRTAGYRIEGDRLTLLDPEGKRLATFASGR